MNGTLAVFVIPYTPLLSTIDDYHCSYYYIPLLNNPYTLSATGNGLDTRTHTHQNQCSVLANPSMLKIPIHIPLLNLSPIS